MSPRPRPPRRERAHRRLVLGLLAVTLIAAGCAAPPPRGPAPEPAPTRTSPLLGRDQDFAIVVAQRGDDFAKLAKQYLGDAGKGWWIAEFNDVDHLRPGDDVVIPLKARNPIGVYPNGYQTVTILCYHRFGPSRSAMTMSPASFESQMDYLARNGYHVATMAQFGRFLQGKEPLPKKTVLITIDDGYRSTFQIAYPVLEKHGFPATVYLYSDFVGASDAMTWAQMHEMASSGLIEIQPHSKTHANLTVKLAGESDAKYAERMRREVSAPIHAIRDHLSLGSYSFAYPYGDVNDLVADVLEHDGVQVGATVTAGGNGFFAYPYMVRRTMIFGTDDLDAFKAKLATFTQIAAR
jgi:peptidoglycan/xylan/chitin deacetylase (PgdA/CDA1 family)